MTELYDTIQLGIAALAISTPISVWLHGRMKYGSGDTKETISSNQQATLQAIEEVKQKEETERVRLQTRDYAKELEADLQDHEFAERLSERRQQMLADPNVSAYLDRREKLGRELSEKKGIFSRRIYGDSVKLGEALDAILGENPFEE